MVNPYLTQGSLNASTCTSILDEAPRLEQQAIPLLGIRAQVGLLHRGISIFRRRVPDPNWRPGMACDDGFLFIPCCLSLVLDDVERTISTPLLIGEGLLLQRAIDVPSIRFQP